MGIIWTALVGLIVGYIARAILPGKDKLGMGMTAALGIVAGLLGGLLGGDSGREFLGMQTGGIFWSIGLAILLLIGYRMFNNKK
jgi:uncharacterized membrane protein YeaQ/YmgE (transglycosylase-associated protein family)